MTDELKFIFAKTLYTGRAVLSDAFLIFKGKTIVDVLSEPKGEKAGEFPVVTPAFIDAHSHIGMVRAGEPQGEGESNEHHDSIIVLADALDSIQMDDSAFQDAVQMGVLYSCVLPGSGNIIGGMSAVIRNYAKNSTKALVGRAGLKAALGYNPMSTRQWKGTRPTTRMGALGVLRGRFDRVLGKREKFLKASEEKKEESRPDAEEKLLLKVLDKRLRLRVHVHKIDDIASLLRLVDEFKIDVSVEHAMDVHSPEIFTELKKRNIPVVYGPLDSFAYKVELRHENWRNIRHLLDSKVRFALMSDHPVTPAHQLFYHTRWFLRMGLSRQEAIEIVTRQNAECIGVQNILGTLEKGKWASFVCWNKSPFDLAGYPIRVYGEGRTCYEDTHFFNETRRELKT